MGWASPNIWVEPILAGPKSAQKKLGWARLKGGGWAEARPKVLGHHQPLIVLGWFWPKDVFGLGRTLPIHFGLGRNWSGPVNSWTLHYSLCRTVKKARPKMKKKKEKGGENWSGGASWWYCWWRWFMMTFAGGVGVAHILWGKRGRRERFGWQQKWEGEVGFFYRFWTQISPSSNHEN